MPPCRHGPKPQEDGKYHLSLFPNLLFCWNYCGFQQNFCFCQQVPYCTLSRPLLISLFSLNFLCQLYSIIYISSTPNPQRTFEFIDCKNLSVSVNWNDEAAIWVCTISAEVSYNGIILPYGAVPQSNYLTLPLGAFELNCSDNTIFLIPVYSDTLQRIII